MAGSTGATTVFGAPRLPEKLISRDRVFSLLSVAADAPITILRGPSGIGKSTALLSWIRSDSRRSEPCIWVDLSFTTPTRDGCWRRVASVVQAAPEGSRVNGMEPPPLTSAAVCVGAVIDLLSLAGPCTLVLDDFQHITEPGITTDVAKLVTSCPDIHVKVLTQQASALEDPLTFPDITPVVLGPQQLLLSRAESSALAQLLAPKMSEKQRQKLIDLSDGTALLLRGFLIAPERVQDVERLVQSARSGEAVPESSFSTVLAEMLQGHPEWARLLRRLVIPSVLPRALAEYLAAPGSAAPLLNRMEQDGYGWWVDTDTGELFHIHAVILSVVRAHTLQEWGDTEALRDLHRDIAQWLSAHGFVTAAVEQAGYADDTHLMVQILKQNFRMLYMQQDPHMFEVISRLPLHVLLREPMLCVLVALHYNATAETTQLAQRFFRAAVVSSRVSRNDPDPINRILLDTTFSGVYRALGAYRQSVAAYDRGWELAEALPIQQRQEHGSLIHALATQGAITQLHIGHFDEAAEAIRRTVATGVTLHPRAGALAAAYGRSAFLAVLGGDIQAARGLAEKARSAPLYRGWINTPEAAPLAMVDARIALASFDLPAARAALDRMLPYLDTIEDWPFLWWVYTVTGLLQGRVRETRTDFRRAVVLAEGRPKLPGFLRGVVDACRVTLDLGVERTVPAKEVRAHDEISALVKMLVLSQNGNPSQVLSLADRWLRGEGSSLFVSLPALVLRAEALRQLRHPDKAVPLLDRAFNLASHQDDPLPLSVLGGEASTPLMTAWEDAHPGETAPYDLRKIPALVPRGRQGLQLTAREHDVLLGLAAGMSTARIAESRHVSVNTVKSQLRSLYRRLGVSSRDEALVRASEYGLLPDTEE